MTTFAPHRDTVEAFVDTMHSGADKDALSAILAEDVVVYILLDADGRIAEVTIWWRPLPAGVQMQRHLAGRLGMKPWELLTRTQ